jgi:SAM-dependent methyltransferase
VTSDIKAYTAYNSRFATHLGDYLTLTTEFPTIRLREFESLVEFAQIHRPRRVLEVPAEGRIIEQLLPASQIVRGDMMETKSSPAGEIILTTWGLGGFQDNSFDAVLSIAPIHHARANEKQAYVEGAWRVLKPRGVLAFGEVAQGSKVHLFLDGFVNLYTRTGHLGLYVDKSFLQTIERAGFEAASSERRDCPWIFSSYDAVYHYVVKLFDLRGVDKDFLLATLQEQLGLREDGDRIVLPWQLLFFRAQKPCDGVETHERTSTTIRHV